MLTLDDARLAQEQMEKFGADSYGEKAEFLGSLRSGAYVSSAWSGEQGNGEELVTLILTVIPYGCEALPARWVSKEFRMGGICKHMQAHMRPTRIDGDNAKTVELWLSPHLAADNPPTLLLTINRNDCQRKYFLH